MLSRDTSARRTARLSSLKGLALGNTAADIVDNLTQGSTHGDFNQTCVVDVTAYGKDLGALALLGTDGCKPFGAFEQNHGNIGVGLNIVEDGGLFPQTLNSRERRTGSGLTALTFDGGHQRSFLTTDESTGTQADIHIKGEVGAKDVFT